jgi:hypothetical protein
MKALSQRVYDAEHALIHRFLLPEEVKDRSNFKKFLSAVKDTSSKEYEMCRKHCSANPKEMSTINLWEEFQRQKNVSYQPFFHTPPIEWAKVTPNVFVVNFLNLEASAMKDVLCPLEFSKRDSSKRKTRRELIDLRLQVGRISKLIYFLRPLEFFWKRFHSFADNQLCLKVDTLDGYDNGERYAKYIPKGCILLLREGKNINKNEFRFIEICELWKIPLVQILY